LSATSKLSLFCHPGSPCAAVQTIEVAATLGNEGLSLRYVVHGDPAAIRLPEPRPAQARDGLWQHSCCEAFIASAPGGEYREFNFSPSGEWAAYRFTAYRERDGAFAPARRPEIALRRHATGFELTACLPRELLPPGPEWHIGLTAVIEAGDGSKSYWALAHAAAQPDFHLHSSFSLILKALGS